MVIKITNNKELETFYKNISKYKNKDVNLDIVDEFDNKEIRDIETALNIKDDFERLKFVYNCICNYLDYYIDNNYCEFDEKGLCAAQRNNKEKSKINGCCGKCMYLGEKGCSINSITCKTFYCNYIKSTKGIPNYKDLKIYKYFLTFPQKLLIETLFFTTEEESLKILYKANIFTWLNYKHKKIDRF